MKIWIDSDACPGAVRDIVLKAVHRHSIETVFVANKKLYVPDAPYISFVKVELGPDIVDQYITANAQAGDLIITQDIPLAADLLALGAVAISPHGTIFSSQNIGERLAVRNMLSDMRDTGIMTGGPKPFGEKQKRDFANAFDQTLTKLLRKNR